MGEKIMADQKEKWWKCIFCGCIMPDSKIYPGVNYCPDCTREGWITVEKPED